MKYQVYEMRLNEPYATVVHILAADSLELAQQYMANYLKNTVFKLKGAVTEVRNVFYAPAKSIGDAVICLTKMEYFE
jgi:hypothetical protein